MTTHKISQWIPRTNNSHSGYVAECSCGWRKATLTTRGMDTAIAAHLKQQKAEGK